MPFRCVFSDLHAHTHPHFPFVIRDRESNFLCMTLWAGWWTKGMSWQAQPSRVLLRIKDYLLLASCHGLHTDCYQLCRWLIGIQNNVFLPEVSVLQPLVSIWSKRGRQTRDVFKTCSDLQDVQGPKASNVSTVYANHFKKHTGFSSQKWSALQNASSRADSLKREQTRQHFWRIRKHFGK